MPQWVSLWRAYGEPAQPKKLNETETHKKRSQREPEKTPAALLTDVRELILSTRQTVARGVNAALVMLYWKIGERILKEVLRQKRAEYGEEILPTLSAKLIPEFGKGFSARNLARMIQFAEVFPEQQIAATLSQQLGWSHFVELLPLKKHLQRDFYAEMCRIERWSVRTLRKKIAGMLYERMALAKKPSEMAAEEIKQLRAEDKLTPDLVFRDPRSALLPPKAPSAHRHRPETGQICSRGCRTDGVLFAVVEEA